MMKEKRMYRLLPIAKTIYGKLPKGYESSLEDVLRLNMVSSTLICIDEGDFLFKLRTAIEHLTIDLGIEQPNPYQIFIDAGFFEESIKKEHQDVVEYGVSFNPYKKDVQ